MKKILVICMILVLTSTLCACNMSLGLGNLEFDKVHIDTHNYSGCFTIEKWYDNSTGIEVKTKECGSMFLTEGTYFLISEDCPFCTARKTTEGGAE